MDINKYADEKDRISNEIVSLLQEVYNSRLFTDLMELCQGEAMTLIFLSDNSERSCNPAEISSQLGISRQRVTAILNNLKKKGFIDMTPSVTDRRRIDVNITAQGDSFIRKKTDHAEKYFDILIEKMGLENIMHFAKLFNQAAKCISDEMIEQEDKI